MAYLRAHVLKLACPVQLLFPNAWPNYWEICLRKEQKIATDRSTSSWTKLKRPPSRIFLDPVSAFDYRHPKRVSPKAAWGGWRNGESELAYIQTHRCFTDAILQSAQSHPNFWVWLSRGIAGLHSPFILVSCLEPSPAGPNPPISCRGMEDMSSNGDLKGREWKRGQLPYLIKSASGTSCKECQIWIREVMRDRPGIKPPANGSIPWLASTGASAKSRF